MGLLAGGILVAAFPDMGSGGGLGLASDPPDPSEDPDPHARTDAESRPRHPRPRRSRSRRPSRPPSGPIGADLCEPIFGFSCGQDAGRYYADPLRTGGDFDLGGGWATELHQADRVQLVRDTGRLTFLGDVTRIYPKGKEEETKGSLKRIIGRVASTDGTQSSNVRDLTIDGHPGFSVDLTTQGGELLPILGAGAETVYLQPFATTRFVLLDVGRRTLAIVIEPGGGATLQDILSTADDVAGSLDIR